MATTYLTRTPSSSTNNRTFTLSVWVKRAKISDRQAIIAQAVDGSNETQIWFDNDDTLLMFQNSSNSTQFAIRTNRLFRDTTAWYHIVMAFDTTQATDTNRVKLYINGVQETSFNSPSYPSQNFDTRWNSTTPVEVGRIADPPKPLK